MAAIEEWSPSNGCHAHQVKSPSMSNQLITCIKFMRSLWTLNRHAIGVVTQKVIGSKSLKIIGLGSNLAYLLLMLIGREFS